MTEMETPEPTAPQIIDSDNGAKDGLNKCVRCGASDVSFNLATTLLRCDFCRHEWSTPLADTVLGINGDISKLLGVMMGSGSTDVVLSGEETTTLKCTACGAEVVIDTRESMQARCHWCRNTLSINEKMPNGAVPDMILPFALSKEAAIDKISKFVGKRKFYAHPRFREEFNPQNVLGVYMPYMVVDINAGIQLSGRGEHQTRSYTVSHGKNSERRYDADLYDVVRTFDIHIDDLTVESNSARHVRSASTTNNIINSIMPFDVENSVLYDANYLRGFTSERRDSNVEELAPVATVQAQDVARHRAKALINFYDRGVRWSAEQIDMRGQRWVSAYLPVWLYSYYQRKGNGKTVLHYVAVNARTGETMGSVPVNQPKLLAVSAVIQVAAFGAVALMMLGGLL